MHAPVQKPVRQADTAGRARPADHETQVANSLGSGPIATPAYLNSAAAAAAQPVQRKSELSSPGDALEREADEVAAKVQQAPESHVAQPFRRQPPANASVERQASQPGSGQSDDRPAGGTPIPEAVRYPVERALGADLSRVRAHQDGAAQAAARRLNARAFTSRDDVWLGAGQSSQDLGLMAHELTHVVQQRAAPSGSRIVQRKPVGIDPEARPGVDELSAAVSDFDVEKVLAILKANSRPEHMRDLKKTYGEEAFMEDMRRVIDSRSDWAKASAYLGLQSSLYDELFFRRRGLIASADVAGIFRAIEDLPDGEALRMFEASYTGPAHFPVLPYDTGGAAPSEMKETWQLMEYVLGVDDRYRAMRMLLAKAERAAAAREAEFRSALPYAVLELQPDAHTALGAAPGSSLSLFLQSDMVVGEGDRKFVLDTLSRRRVDLAIVRVESNDRRDFGDQHLDIRPAILAVADLKGAERAYFAQRLETLDLDDYSASDVATLKEIAAEPDDATALRRVLDEVSHIDTSFKGPTTTGMMVAAERAGEMLQIAKSRLAALGADATDAQRKAARDEVERLEGLFADRELYREIRSSNYSAYQGLLATMGATPLDLAVLRIEWAQDFDALVDILQDTPRDVRRQLILERTAQSRIQRLGLSERQQEIVAAYQSPYELDEMINGLWLDLGADELQDLPPLDRTQLPTVTIGREGPTNRAIVMAFELEQAWKKGDRHVVFARIYRASPQERNELAEAPQFQRFVAKLKKGRIGDQVAGSNLGHALRGDALNVMERYALEYTGFNWGNVRQVPEDENMFIEWVGARMAGRQADMRRAYVLHQRQQSQPGLRLDEKDQKLVDEYDFYRRLGAEMDNEKQEELAQVLLGQPQLIHTAESALDPNLQADFMYHRVRGRLDERTFLSHAGDRVSWGGPTMDESVAAFLSRYDHLRPGGISPAELPELAVLYHDAMRATDRFVKENESFAATAAIVVGAVVATVVVSVASGGTLTPVAVGVLASLAGGTTAAATGAAIRGHSTEADIFRDFAGGAVEGVLAAAGAPLASRAVRALQVGKSAGHAATAAGGRAVRTSTGIGARIAETVIDGAIGGAGGELFQTATDEATWDRGISEAFAKMLAAVSRGALFGAAGALVFGSVAVGIQRHAARFGARSARGFTSFLDNAGLGRTFDDIAADSQAELSRAYALVEAGKLDEAEAVLRRIDTLSDASRETLIATARGQEMVRTITDIGSPELAMAAGRVQVVDDAAFRKLAGPGRGHAVIRIEADGPRIYLRKGSDPSVIREELIHFHQFQSDLPMRERMLRLSEEKLARWNEMPVNERLGLYLDKLEIEADAQRRILAMADTGPEGEVSGAVDEVLAAEETLFVLNERIVEVRRALSSGDINPRVLGWDPDEPARMYARGAAGKPTGKGRAAKEAQKLIDSNADANSKSVRKKLKELGYRVHQRDGRVFRITRDPKKTGELPHLSVIEGRIVEGRPRADWTTTRSDAAVEWQRASEDIAVLQKRVADDATTAASAKQARESLATYGVEFRDRLAQQVAAGKIDEADAGLASRWARVVDELESRTANLGGDRAHLRFGKNEALAALPGGPGQLTHTNYKAFRHRIRNATADYLASIPDGTERMKALYEMLALQPDSRSMGELFTAYRQQRMSKVKTEFGHEAFQFEEAIDPFQSKAFRTTSDTRTPDDVIEQVDDVDNWLPPGRYAYEDKTGKGAFKLEQAEDYSRMSDPALPRRTPGGKGEDSGGFRLRAGDRESAYDGLVYVFSRKDEAEKALASMIESDMIKPLIGRHPGGIHVAYYDAGGDLMLMTKIPDGR